MRTLALGLSLALIAGCGVAAAQQAAQPAKPWGGPGASVTKAQAQEMAGRMFDRLDVNKDGKLDKADRDAREASFKQAMFERMDANRDGQISRDEFMSFKPEGPGGRGMGGPSMGGPGMGGPGMGGPGMGGPGMGGRGMGGPGGMRGHGMGPGMGGMRGMGGMMMRMADANRDGAVTRDEFMAAFSQQFDRMDANHDGTVTLEERRAAREAMRRRMHDRMGGRDMGGMGGPGAMPPPPAGN